MTTNKILSSAISGSAARIFMYTGLTVASTSVAALEVARVRSHTGLTVASTSVAALGAASARSMVGPTVNILGQVMS